MTLFVIPWFLPICSVKREAIPPAAIWVILFAYPDHLGESLTGICFFSLFFGVPAVAIGWVLQCIVVMFRDTMRRRR